MIFHNGEKGVTIHKPGKFPLPRQVLQECKSKGAKFWMISADEPLQKEWVNNMYDLPSIRQKVWYLYVAVGFLVKETWIKAIKVGHMAHLNSLTSMDEPIHPIFLGLCKSVITSPILVRSASQRYQNLAEFFSYNYSISHLHTVFCINDPSRGSVSSYKNHNFS
jgi:hypothetical protein